MNKQINVTKRTPSLKSVKCLERETGVDQVRLGQARLGQVRLGQVSLVFDVIICWEEWMEEMGIKGEKWTKGMRGKGDGWKEWNNGDEGWNE